MGEINYNSTNKKPFRIKSLPLGHPGHDLRPGYAHFTKETHRLAFRCNETIGFCLSTIGDNGIAKCVGLAGDMRHYPSLTEDGDSGMVGCHSYAAEEAKVALTDSLFYGDVAMHVSLLHHQLQGLVVILKGVAS